MSRPDTGDRQRERLEQLGHRVVITRELVDVDDVDDALEVAGLAPDTAFARLVGRLGLDGPGRSAP